MSIKKLKRSFLCFVMVFCMVFSLGGCKGKEILTEEMPEIVFVVYQLYNDDYNEDGEYIGKKYEGYYITRTGEIMYFEFNKSEVDLYKKLDEEKYERMENGKFTMTDLVEYHNFEAFHKKMTEYAVPSGYDRVPEEKLKNCYSKLFKVKMNRKVKGYCTIIDLYFGHTDCYGVMIDENSNQQFIPIYELDSCYFIIKDKNCKKLHENLKALIPDEKLCYF